jgi:hypothetical protein
MRETHKRVLYCTSFQEKMLGGGGFTSVKDRGGGYFTPEEYRGMGECGVVITSNLRRGQRALEGGCSFQEDQYVLYCTNSKDSRCQ